MILHILCTFCKKNDIKLYNTTILYVLSKQFFFSTKICQLASQFRNDRQFYFLIMSGTPQCNYWPSESIVYSTNVSAASYFTAATSDMIQICSEHTCVFNLLFHCESFGSFDELERRFCWKWTSEIDYYLGIITEDHSTSKWSFVEVSVFQLRIVSFFLCYLFRACYYLFMLSFYDEIFTIITIILLTPKCCRSFTRSLSIIFHFCLPFCIILYFSCHVIRSENNKILLKIKPATKKFYSVSFLTYFFHWHIFHIF